MRQVTLLNLAQVQDPTVKAALDEIQKASADNIINDVAQSGAALSTINNATADTVPYFTSATTAAVTALTSFARSLIAAVDQTSAQAVLGIVAGSPALLIANNLSDLADVPTARSNLGLVIGTTVQAFSTFLTAFTAIGTGIAVRTGTNTVTARSIIAGSGITVSNGDGIADNPTIAAIGSAPVLLATVSGPSSGAYTFASSIDSTYSKYRFDLFNIVPVSGSAQTILQVSTDGGSTWKNTVYFGAARQQQVAGAGADDSYTTFGAIFLHHTSNTQAAGTPITGTVELFTPSNASFIKDISFWTRYTDTSGTNCTYIGRGFWSGATTAINAIKFFNNGAGGLASGTIKMYGIP